MSEVMTEKPVVEMDARTLASLGLKKEIVYVPTTPAKPKSANAERVARHRERKAKKMADAGLVNTAIPKAIVDQIAALGSFAAWLEQIKDGASVPSNDCPPPPLTPEQIIGERVVRLKGWRRRVVEFLIG